LLLLASIVLSGLLRMQTCSRAVHVQVAIVVHGLLQAVTLPAEEVISVSGSSTILITILANRTLYGIKGYLPKVHAVDERIGTVGGPHVAIGKLGHVPHKFIHDLRKLGGMTGRAVASTISTGS
jgi:hypothetical protein